jgi:hypothetical protein
MQGESILNAQNKLAIGDWRLIENNADGRNCRWGIVEMKTCSVIVEGFHDDKATRKIGYSILL